MSEHLAPDYWRARHTKIKRWLENSTLSKIPSAERDVAALTLYLDWIKAKWLKSEARLARLEEAS